MNPEVISRPSEDSLDDFGTVEEDNGAPPIQDEPEPKPKPDGTGTSLIPIFLSLMVDLISFAAILPLFPSLLQYYREHDESGTYHYWAQKAEGLRSIIGAPKEAKSETVLIGGMLGSLFCLLQFISGPMIGAISDRYGRRLALILCLLGICISHIVWLMSSDFAIFILARIIGGFSRANVSICSTIVADDCPAASRPKGMAMIGIAFSVGFTVGPMIGAYFALSGSLIAPAVGSLFLSIISLLIVVFRVKETLPKESRAQGSVFDFASYLWPPNLFNFRLVSVGKELKQLGTAYFVYIFLYSGLEFTLSFLVQSKHGYTTTNQGKMFTFMGIVMAVTQGKLIRTVTPAVESYAAVIAVLIMIPSFLLIGSAGKGNGEQLYIGLFTYSIGSAVVSPVLTSIIASRVDRANEKGVALGIFRSLGALARSLGPLFASTLFWKVGPTYAYILGGICFVLPLYLIQQATVVYDAEIAEKKKPKPAQKTD